jgi:predicted O-methyltransferase YrrM
MGRWTLCFSICGKTSTSLASDLFYPKLSPGTLIAADNMIDPESAQAHARAYQEHVRTKPHIESVLLPVGSGIELTRFK